MRTFAGLEPLAHATVRIRRSSDERSGQGLCVALSANEVFVLTCYHVIGTARAHETLWIDFFSSNGRLLRQGVKATRCNARSDPKRDVAVLRIDASGLDVPGVELAPVEETCDGGPVFGYLRPTDQSFTRLEARLGTACDVLVETEGGSGSIRAWPLKEPTTVEEGISGCPIVSADGKVVGLVHGAIEEAPSNPREAYAIPIEEWFVRNPELRGLARSNRDAVLSKFQGMTSASAACCAELAGDGTVLVTGKVLLATFDIYVHVALADAARTGFDVYEARNGQWTPDDDIARKFKKIFGPIFDAWPGVRSKRQALTRRLIEERFLNCLGSYHIMVVFEAPIGSGILEESAFAVALSRALIEHKLRTNRLPPDHRNDSAVSDPIPDEQVLAGLLLSAWHTHMSWATIVGSTLEPSAHTMLWFDRASEEPRVRAPDLLKLYEDTALAHEETQEVFRRNAAPVERFWEAVPCELDGHLSLWYHPDWQAPLFRAAHPVQTAKAVVNLRSASKALMKEMKIALFRRENKRDYRIGLLMQMHQLILELAGFVDSEVQPKLKSVNGDKAVLGAKLACGRAKGAILVLTDANPQWSLVGSHAGFLPLSDVVQKFNR